MPLKTKTDVSLNDILEKGVVYDCNDEEYSYENRDYVVTILKLYKEYSSNICFSYYLNKHISYMYIMDVETPNRCILCKIGYTYSLDTREKSICSDFGCNLYPVGFIEVNSEADEKRLHRLILDKYPHLPYVIDKKQKKTDSINKKYEIYKLDPVLFQEFFRYNINLNTNIVLLEGEKTKQEQEKTKQEQEKTKQMLIDKGIYLEVEQEKTKQMLIELELIKSKLSIHLNKTC
jgi:hypothetical protein